MLLVFDYKKKRQPVQVIRPTSTKLILGVPCVEQGLNRKHVSNCETHTRRVAHPFTKKLFVIQFRPVENRIENSIMSIVNGALVVFLLNIIQLVTGKAEKPNIILIIADDLVSIWTSVL